MIIISGIGGILVSSFIVVGTSLIQYEPLSKKSILGIIGISFFVTSLIVLLINSIPTIKHWLRNNYIENKLSKYFYSDSNKIFFIFWAVIFICFIPVLLATWPGIFSYDATSQMMMFDGVEQFTSHQPPLHTFLIGACFSLGRLIYPSDGNTIGMAVYSLMQMLVMSGIFGYSCWFLCKRRTPTVLILLSAVFWGLFPVNQIFAVECTKDVIFGGLILLFVLFTIEIIENPKTFFSSFILPFRYCMCAIFMCLMRNNAIYAFIVFGIIFIIVYRKYFLKSLTICLTCVIVYLTITGPVFSCMNISDGDFREALAVPIQQLSAVEKYNEQELSEEQISFITNLLGAEEQISSNFDKWSADPEKCNFNTDKFTDNILYSIKEYISIGLKFPKTYVYSWLYLTLPYFYPNFVFQSESLQTSATYIFYDNINADQAESKVYRESKIPKLDDLYRNISNNDKYQNLPIINILFSQGMILIFFIVAILALSYQKKYKMILSLLMPIVIFATFLLGPVALTRYTYGIMIILPILSYIIFNDAKNNPKDIKSNNDKNVISILHQ